MQALPPEIIAPVVVSIALFVTTGAVLIFRPLTKRLGDRIAASSKQPTIVHADEAELARMRQALEETNARLELMEQRLDFTERLLTGPREGTAIPGSAARGRLGPPEG
jgi:hypothetical protein